ncbi:hypothetical protein GCM10009865_54770 [Aeromicrobium ponti]|uniref:Uncharacterized protein n=1 Tax=Cytobacillus oceanisediminis TaxID=665099 RepID=A0A562J3F5_9BACI|nr:hypothetical protein [Cytobacillus oceanisediminis]TWH77680.1 hypothetical protein IQ19_05594 [Cytobacillus oceanisediminis]
MVVQQKPNRNPKIANQYGKIGFGHGPIIAAETQKYMLHFWGDKEILTKPLKVIGVRKETGKEITVFQSAGSNQLSPNLGANHHKPSAMMLPSAGLCRLEGYFGDELFGNVVVNVMEK